MTSSIDPQAARDFATKVVLQLRNAGFEAIWAGGCVRDQLRGTTPKDYDIATSALPEEIRQIFGSRRTIAIGAAFGVITVLGPKQAGQVEVATFRSDATYSDGRHPDSVEFTNDREDALRRDFTVNGLFYDPIEDQVIDYVGGQRDLQLGIIRAIGDPHHRIDEDKLRMLRAVRFASTFGFRLDENTKQAISAHAREIHMVSVERVAEELRRMLVLASRRRAVELLASTGLLAEILPELAPLLTEPPPDVWQVALRSLAALQIQSFPAALALLLRALAVDEVDRNNVQPICRRWRLSNQETTTIIFCLEHEGLIRRASQLRWSKLQRVLIQPNAVTMIEFTAAVVAALGEGRDDIDLCRTRLKQPEEILNPSPLISGNDLPAIGIAPGPVFRTILNAVRDAQLDDRIETREQALALARELADSASNKK